MSMSMPIIHSLKRKFLGKVVILGLGKKSTRKPTPCCTETKKAFKDKVMSKLHSNQGLPLAESGTTDYQKRIMTPID